MSKLSFIALNALVKEKFPDLDARKKAATITAAIVASRGVPLPASEVDSAEEHYSVAVASAISDMLSGFNEEIVIDLELAIQVARGFWLVRYFTAFPNVDGMLGSNGEGEFLMKLTGGMRYVSAEVMGFCQANDVAMIVLINRASIAMKPSSDTDGDHEYR